MSIFTSSESFRAPKLGFSFNASCNRERATVERGASKNEFSTFPVSFCDNSRRFKNRLIILLHALSAVPSVVFTLVYLLYFYLGNSQTKQMVPLLAAVAESHGSLILLLLVAHTKPLRGFIFGLFFPGLVFQFVLLLAGLVGSLGNIVWVFEREESLLVLGTLGQEVDDVGVAQIFVVDAVEQDCSVFIVVCLHEGGVVSEKLLHELVFIFVG